MKKNITLLTLSLISILFIGCGDTYQASSDAQSSVQSPNLSAGADLYASKGCSGCHGVDGGTSALGVSRIIVDIASERDVQNALYSLRAQVPQRDAIMLAQAQDLSNQEILDLATYIYFQRH